MAKKSKTQKAKASARRAEKKAASQELDTELKYSESDASDGAEGAKDAAKEVKASKASKAEDSSKKASSEKNAESSKAAKSSNKDAKAPKKKSGIVKFFGDVRSELKRVTWPSRQDVLQWSGVVVVALLFFGIYVAILDSGIITPLLVAYSGLGA